MAAEVVDMAKAVLEIINADGRIGWWAPEHSCSEEHIVEMCERIINEEITGTKAHRWIGWVQGVVVFAEQATLEQMKEANRG